MEWDQDRVAAIAGAAVPPEPAATETCISTSSLLLLQVQSLGIKAYFLVLGQEKQRPWQLLQVCALSSLCLSYACPHV